MSLGVFGGALSRKVDSSGALANRRPGLPRSGSSKGRNLSREASSSTTDLSISSSTSASDNSFDYDASILRSSKMTELSPHPKIAITVVYFVGILAYNDTTRKYQWMGTWLASLDYGKPKPMMSDFIKSVNFFEFHSDEVSPNAALNLDSARFNEFGSLCGLLKLTNTRFRGYLTIPRGGGVFMRKENDFRVVVTAVRNSKGVINKYNIKSPQGKHSDVNGIYSMVGVFDCETGILEMTRSY